jgi:hypothetical protein
VSSTKEDELREYCAQYETDGFEGVSKEEQVLLSLRETINDVDDTVGGLISSTMCSAVCPCDLDITDDNGTQAAWTAIFADDTQLEKFDRCKVGAVDCDETKAIISFIDDDERQTYETAAGFEIKSY